MKENKSKLIFIILIIVELIIIGAGVFVIIKLSAPSTGKTTKSETSTKTEEKEKDNSKYKMYVLLDGMTTDEIVENVKNISKISTGDSAKEFTDRFILGDGVRILQDKTNVFGQYPQWNFYADSDYAYVSQIDTYGLSEADDGTIVVGEGAQITPYIVIKDRAVAEEIYTKVKKQIFLEENIDTDNTTEKGYYTEAFIGNKHYTASLAHYSDSSIIKVQIPVK